MAGTPKHLGGHMGVTHVDTGAIQELCTRAAIDKPAVLDIGCGPGGQVKALRELGIPAFGIDGDPSLPDTPIWQEHPEWFFLGDFSKERGGLVWKDCVNHLFLSHNSNQIIVWMNEFVEHVEERFIPNYIVTVQCCGYVIMTPGITKGGYHHVCIRPPDFWRGVFAGAGFRYNETLTEAVRAASTMERNFIRDSGLVFVRNYN